MIRLSPLADAPPEAGKQAGAAQSSRLAARTLTDDRVNAFPIYYTAGAMTSVCWPLVDWDDRGWAVRPLYNRDGDNESILFPLCAWDKTSGWALNTVWDDEKGWMFAPLFGSWDKTDFVFPVFVTERPGESAPAVRVFPIWYSDAKEERVELLYSHRHDETRVSRELLMGLLYNDTVAASGESRSTWLFPVGVHKRDKTSSSWLTLPVSAGHDEKSAWMNIHPFWWSSSGERWSSETLLPLWHRRVTGDERVTYTPLGLSRSRGVDAETTTWLYGYGHDAERSWFNIHPLWWSSQGRDSESRLLFPVYYSMRDGEASATFNPLWFHRRRGDYDSVVSWLYSRGRDRDERWFNVHPFWWSWSAGKESVDVLAPVYLRVDDGKVATAYTPIGYHETTADTSRWATLPFSSGHAGGRSWLNIHPLWWSSDAENESMRALFPLYYTRHAGNASATYTPLSFYESAGENHRVITLPYSEGRDGERTWLNIHPLWWSSDSPTGSLRALLPFYYRSRDGDSTDSYTWLGYHGTKGEASRWVTLPFSAGHEGRRSWLNIHPLWWSSTDEKRTVRTLVPLWSTERMADGSGSFFTPLGCAEYGKDGRRDFLNVLGLGYQWNRENDTTVSTHVLWPLYAGHHATADVDADFVGRFGLVAHETAPNLDAFRLSPLWSQASGPGVSPARDWLHLVSRRTLAGETSTTVTPLVETVSNDADGRWRVTPLASSAELQDDTIWRDWLHLVSVRRDEKGSSYSLTPLFQKRGAHAASELRLTPLFDTGTGKYAPMDPWTPHLFVHGRDGERRFWSFTPLAAGVRTAQAESEYVLPFYRYEARDGVTVSRMVFPFYAEGEDDTFPEALCLVSRLRTPQKETRSWFGPVWRREIFHARPQPDAGLILSPMRIPIDTTSGLFTSENRYVHMRLDDGAFSADELALLRRWREEDSRLRTLEVLRLRPTSPEAGEIRRYWNPATEESLRELHVSMMALLRRHGPAPEVETVEAMQAALNGLVARHATSTESHRFAVDPLWIDLYQEADEPGVSTWTFLWGVGRGEYRNGYGRSSVLSYLYTKEVSPDGVRMNCFPFIQRDETTERRKVSFLWRVWNRETEVKTGKVKGHFLFIPY